MGGVYMTLLNSSKFILLCAIVLTFLVYNMGGVWVETTSLKALGVLDRDLELDKDYCKKYENGSAVYDPNGTKQKKIHVKTLELFRNTIHWLG